MLPRRWTLHQTDTLPTQARWHPEIGNSLVEGAKKALQECGVKPENIVETEVPGSFELPLAARYMALSGTVSGGLSTPLASGARAAREGWAPAALVPLAHYSRSLKVAPRTANAAARAQSPILPSHSHVPRLRFPMPHSSARLSPGLQSPSGAIPRLPIPLAKLNLNRPRHLPALRTTAEAPPLCPTPSPLLDSLRRSAGGCHHPDRHPDQGRHVPL